MLSRSATRHPEHFTPPASMTGSDEPRDPGWQGRNWSEWCPLDGAKPPTAEGIYRVRLRGRGRRLLYIGMSGSLRGRLGQLRRDVRRGTSREHTAGGVLSVRCGARPPGALGLMDRPRRRGAAGDLWHRGGSHRRVSPGDRRESRLSVAWRLAKTLDPSYPLLGKGQW